MRDEIDKPEGLKGKYLVPWAHGVNPESALRLSGRPARPWPIDPELRIGSTPEP